MCFQAEDGIRDLVRSRGLGDVYKRQRSVFPESATHKERPGCAGLAIGLRRRLARVGDRVCLLYTSDAADERSSVDLGGRRIIKKKTREKQHGGWRL